MDAKRIRWCSFYLTLILCLTGAVSGQATVLACKPGIKPRIFAHLDITVSQTEQARFQHQFETWGNDRGYDVSSVGSSDPYTHPATVTWTSFLQSAHYGVVLEAAGTNRTDHVAVRIENNCWADPEDWKPHWRILKAQLESMGYPVR